MQTIYQPVQSSMYVIPRVWWWTITSVYWRNKTGIMISTSSTYLPSLKNNAFILGNYTKNPQRPSKLVPSKHQGDGKRLKKNIRNQTSSIKTPFINICQGRTNILFDQSTIQCTVLLLAKICQWFIYTNIILYPWMLKNICKIYSSAVYRILQKASLVK